MNVRFDQYNTGDVAQLLGVTHQTVSYWCKNGFIRYQDVSEPSSGRPRYMFSEDEVNRVSKLIDRYGKRKWVNYNDIVDEVKAAVIPTEAKEEVIPTKEPVQNESVEELELDDTQDILQQISKIKHLKAQRASLLAELDSIDEAIKNMREKVLEAI